MKKNLFLGFTLLVGLSVVSCKTKESSFKKAYEQAKAEEMAQQQTPQRQQPVQVTPVQTNTPTQPVDENVKVQTERLDVLNGGSLKAYNVVCGSFKSADNANNLRNTLVNAGYNAQVAKNPETGMLRVIASSFDEKSDAVRSRNDLRAKYPDAWILYRTY